MCGRYQISDDKDIEEIKKILQEINDKCNGTDITAKTGEIYPTNYAPILSMIDHKPSLSIMKWGFPKWDGKGSIINAKSETAKDKKMFAKPLLEKRCVIPSSGFYEWKQEAQSKVKQKFLFTADNSPMLYMAGFYNAFKVEEQIKEHFIILTRKANRYVSDVHDRMPIILHKNELITWLNNESFIPFAFKRDDIVLEKQVV